MLQISSIDHNWVHTQFVLQFNVFVISPLIPILITHSILIFHSDTTHTSITCCTYSRYLQYLTGRTLQNFDQLRISGLSSMNSPNTKTMAVGTWMVIWPAIEANVVIAQFTCYRNKVQSVVSDPQNVIISTVGVVRNQYFEHVCIS